MNGKKKYYEFNWCDLIILERLNITILFVLDIQINFFEQFYKLISFFYLFWLFISFFPIIPQN